MENNTIIYVHQRRVARSGSFSFETSLSFFCNALIFAGNRWWCSHHEHVSPRLACSVDADVETNGGYTDWFLPCDWCTGTIPIETYILVVLGSLTMISLAITCPSITEMNGDCDVGFGVMNIRYGQGTTGRGVIMCMEGL
jgi:hypothetical protein